MAQVLTIGGVFFRSKDRVALGEWYRKHLGMAFDTSYHGVSFPRERMPQEGFHVWSLFQPDNTYFPPGQPFMVNLVVDDLEGALAQVAAGGATVDSEREVGEFGARLVHGPRWQSGGALAAGWRHRVGR